MINLSTFLYQESLAQSRDWSDEQILPLNLRECTGRSLFLKFSPVRVDVLNGKKDIADKKAIDDDLKAKLIAAVEDFKKGFQP